MLQSIKVIKVGEREREKRVGVRLKKRTGSFCCARDF
jgi:hypothetical protein